MLKQFLFSTLIICVTLAHGMDSPTSSKKSSIKSRFFRIIHIKDKKTTSKKEPDNPFFNYDILGWITQKMLTTTIHDLKQCRTNIRELSRTNSILYHYYTNEKIGQNIVRAIAILNNRSDLYVAGFFGYIKIRDKMFNLMYTCSNTGESFTTQDLEDRWYLNGTYTTTNIYSTSLQLSTPLLIAIKNMDENKVEALIGAGADCNNSQCINPISLLTGQDILFNNYEILSRTTQKKYFAIINALLKKKLNPDARQKLALPTLLHRASSNGDQAFACLLLQNGANPYKLYLDYNYPYELFMLEEKYSKKYSVDSLYTKTNNEKKPWKCNAFLLETGKPKGWLKTMYDEIQQKK